jgi:hypothetical protein
VSTSFHELGQLRAAWGALNYAFLSPVFDSVSKEGYGAAFEEAALRTALSSATVPVVALGGRLCALSRHRDPGHLPRACSSKAIKLCLHSPSTRTGS